jgi:hypothetical protein
LIPPEPIQSIGQIEKLRALATQHVQINAAGVEPGILAPGD